MSDAGLVNKDPSIALLLTCADWRLHSHPVDLNARMARVAGCEFIDVVAVPGPDGLIHPGHEGEWDAAVKQIKVLIKNHNVQVVVVAAHQRCAGHPVSDEAHLADVQTTIHALKRDTGFGGPIHATMLMYKSELDWDIAPVAVI